MKGEVCTEGCKPVVLNEQERVAFHRAIKTGVYKQLHRDGLLTDQQLSKLLEQNL